MDADEAKETVRRVLDGAKARTCDEMERALRRIANGFPTRAAMVADEALGTGPFWRKGFGRVPKSYPSYVWERFKAWVKYGPRPR